MDPSDAVFSGAVPERYERFMVPMLFAPFAADLARRVVGLAPASVLEIAAGTGAVTRKLAHQLAPSTRFVATDINEGMLAQARLMDLGRPIEWLEADAQRLPFDDGSFDVVVCQFGVMFFPDRAAAYAEARRVLTAGGTFVFSTWDSVAHNEFAAVAGEAIAAFLPDDPPAFIERTPHGYFEHEQIRADLALAGFADEVTIDIESHVSRAPDAETAARSYVEGTPLRGEIEQRRPGSIAEATAVAADAFRRRFGAGVVEAEMRAILVTARRG